MKVLFSLTALLLTMIAAFAQQPLSQPYSYLSAASTNSTQVYTGPSLLQSLFPINTTATTYYLKVYDTAVAPTCGTGTPKIRIPIPPQSTGGGAVPVETSAMQFGLGVGFCLTSGIADNDTGNAATGVVINLGVVQQ